MALVNGNLERLVADSIGPPTFLDNPDAVYIHQLTQTGLSDLAIEVCRSRQKLAGDTNSDGSVRWATLLMDSITSKIIADSAIEDLDKLSARFGEVENVVKEYAETSRYPWIALRSERCRWVIMQRMLAAYQAAPTRTAVRDWTLQEIRDTLNRLEKLQLQLRNAGARTTTKSAGPSPAQWISLHNDTWLLQADLLLIRALFYPTKSTERIAASTEMMSVIDKALQQVSTQWAGRPNLEIARCRAFLLLNRPDESLTQLKLLKLRLEGSGENSKIVDTRWNESIAVIAAQAARELGQLEASRQWIVSAGGWTRSPDLALEHLANLVATANEESRNERMLQEAIQVKEQISSLFGSYWRYRADALLVSNSKSFGGNHSLPADAKNAQVELLMAEALQHLAAKQNSVAIEKLRQAETAAANANIPSKAFEIAIAIASIYAKEEKQDESQEEFYRAAITYPSVGKAPDAALMSVQTISGTPLRTPSQEVITKRLNSILEIWPASSQAELACKSLDEWLIRNNRWIETAQLWQKQTRRAVDTEPTRDSAKTVTIVMAISRYLFIRSFYDLSLFDRSALANEPKEPLLVELNQLKATIQSNVSEVDSRILGSLFSNVESASRWPQKALWPLKAESNDSNSSTLGRWISDLHKREPDSSKSDPISQLALQWAATELLFEQILNTKSKNGQTDNEWIGLCDSSISRLKSLINSKEISRRLDPRISNKLEQNVAIYTAGIDCWNGQVEKGRTSLAAYQRDNPRNAHWLYKSARIFQSVPSERERAIELFRSLANGFPAGSEAWWEARTRTVETYRNMGNSKAADELAEVLRAVYPNVAPEWMSRITP